MATQTELEKALDIIFNRLVSKGMLPAGVSKSLIIENVIGNIDKVGLDNIDLKNPAHQKTLALCLVSEFSDNQLNTPFSERFNYQLLFNPAAKKEQLQEELEKLLTQVNKTNPHMRLEPKQVKKLSEEMAEEIMQIHAEDKAKDENNLTLAHSAGANMLEKLLAEALRNLYGGTDPRFVGSNVTPVESEKGNAADIPNITEGYADSKSYMEQLKNPSATFPDYTGQKTSTIVDLISLTDGLEEEFLNANILHHSPRPDPFHGA